MMASEHTANTPGTRVRRRCQLARTTLGSCGIDGEASCTSCPTDFPSLSLMKPPPKIESPTGRGIRRATHAYPAPAGAPKPLIRPLGNGRYVCESLHGPEERRYRHVGFGGSATYAWNGWVSRLESIKARGAQW